MRTWFPSRRTLLKTSAAALAAPHVITSAGSQERAAPSNRINVGLVGVGERGMQHLSALLKDPTVQVVSLCDLEDARWEAAVAAGNKAYAEQSKDGRHRSIEPMLDFRQVCTSPIVDAVVLATPDHWHALAAVAALKGGKDVYCEAPLSLTIDEGKRIVSAARRYNRVVQVGSQHRSDPACRRACELVREKRIGDLKTITIGLPADRPDVGLQPEQQVPRGFDYDTWIGPAPWAPYTRKRTHFHWRYVSDTGGGEITDRGAHLADLALWAAEDSLKGPITIEPKNGAFYSNSLYDTAIRYDVTFTFAGKYKLIFTSGRPRGVRFEGTAGWLDLAMQGRPTLTASDPKLLEAPLPQVADHYADFFSAIRTRNATVAPAEAGHRAATLCHLANIALRLDRTLTWDPEKEQFVNDDLADRHLSRPYRAPWRLV